MGAISNLGVALLIALAVLSLIALSGELLYILCHRRRRRRRIAGDVEIGGVDTSPSLMLYLLCWKKNQTRVEPAVASPLATVAPPKLETTEEEIDLAVWRAACLGPSRALYTIREEEERDAVVEEEEETPYSTPCASPAFFESPVRAMEWAVGAGTRPV